MEQGKPPHPAPSDAGGRATYRGAASSSSSSPPPQQQGHAIPPVLVPQPSPPRDRGAGAPPFGLPVPGPIPPLHPQLGSQQHPYQSSEASSSGGYLSTVDAGALPLGLPVPGPIPPLHPQLGSQQHPYQSSEASSSGGYLSTVDAGTAARNFEQNPSAISCYYSLGPSALTIWTPSPRDSDPHNWSGASDRFRPAFIPNGNFGMVVQQPLPQQRYAAPTWPEPPHYGPQIGPQLPRDETSSSSSEASEPPIPEDPRLEKIRSELLDSPMMLEQLVLSSPESSAFVVRLLVQGDEHGHIRHRVLDGFVHRAHGIMGNRQGHAVFEALLRICRWRHEELSRIVEAAVAPNLVSRTNDGVTSLRMLIEYVAPHHDLSARLIGSFVHERVMDELEGYHLVDLCFKSMHHEETRALILHALDTIDNKLQWRYGSMCLCKSVRFSSGEELRRFQDRTLGRAADLATGRHSNYFVQRVLDRSGSEFRQDLVNELMGHAANLSRHSCGNYVVQHCFLNQETGEPQSDLLPIVLKAFADLPQEELEDLVQHTPGKLVLHRLLETGIAVTRCQELTHESWR